jgi:lysyl-tRNA synthetase class 1
MSDARLNKPKTSHWADVAAFKVLNKRGPKDQYTFASGITPSGVVHIGNFREVITVDLVARAMRSLGAKVRFIYSWDDFDTFRKVPVNFPNQDMLKKHLRQPICRVPDPFGKAGSYAEHNTKAFEAQLNHVGISPEFIYQHQRYESGQYAEQVRVALEQKDRIRKILDKHRTEGLAEDWVPTSIFCENCQKDELEYERYLGEWDYEYKCQACGHAAKTDIRKTKNLKLSWRTDWPMRWAFEGVDFEPGGKDHSSDGGSFDTGREIVKEVWGKEAPEYLQYDFVSIKGGTGKMSSSRGELYTLGDALEVYDPQIVRWIFANQRPNHDFALAFDIDVIRVYDEFDKTEAMLFSADGQSPKVEQMRRSFELSLVDGVMPSKKPYRPSFRLLCNNLQICDKDIERTIAKFYAKHLVDAEDKRRFVQRAKCALNWLADYATDEFRYEIYQTPQSKDGLSELELKALAQLRSLVETTDLDTIEAPELNQKIYDQVIKGVGIEGLVFFKMIYGRIIGRPQGPRLPSFLKEIGKERLLKIL